MSACQLVRKGVERKRERAWQILTLTSRRLKNKIILLKQVSNEEKVFQITTSIYFPLLKFCLLAQVVKDLCWKWETKSLVLVLNYQMLTVKNEGKFSKSKNKLKSFVLVDSLYNATKNSPFFWS